MTTEVPLKALGIDLILGGSVPLGMPIDVLVISRCIDDQGDTCYRVLCNPELDTVLAIGMTEFLSIYLKAPFKWALGENDDTREGD